MVSIFFPEHCSTIRNIWTTYDIYQGDIFTDTKKNNHLKWTVWQGVKSFFIVEERGQEAYGAVQRGSADQATSDPEEYNSE